MRNILEHSMLLPNPFLDHLLSISKLHQKALSSIARFLLCLLALPFVWGPTLGLAFLGAIPGKLRQVRIISRGNSTYAINLQPLQSLTPDFLAHLSQVFDISHVCHGFWIRALFANSCTVFSAARSHAPPDMQIGAALSITVGSKSAVARSATGERRGTAEWRISVAGLSQVTQRQAWLSKISSLWRFTIEEIKSPVASASGLGPSSTCGTQREAGACSR